MPYKLSPDKLTVLDEDGKPVKKHDTPQKARAHLIQLNLNVKDSPNKPKQATGGKVKEALKRYLEAGARHSKSDSTMVQTIHDHSVELGAMCGEPNE